MSPGYQLTPAQLQVQAERKAAKAAAKAAKQTAAQDPNNQEADGGGEGSGLFLKREWINVGGAEGRKGKSVKVITWNVSPLIDCDETMLIHDQMLAQTLVRRELFPRSDCLRYGDRKPMWKAEIASHSSCDIICLQECDRLNDILPSLPNHAFVKASGYEKQHGLVVLYNSDRFRVCGAKTLNLDQEEVSSGAGDEARTRRGGSRQTKNVGLVVGLEEIDGNGSGIVITTTHLFWHPKYSYERVRQSLCLLRAIRQFRQDNECDSWPAMLVGDLNTQPCEATYQLLTNPSGSLPPTMVEEIDASRRVHRTVDKIEETTNLIAQADSASVSGPGLVTPSEPDGTATPSEPDGTTTPASAGPEPEIQETEGSIEPEGKDGTRAPRQSDGILTLEELVTQYEQVLPDGGLISAYGSAHWNGETFGARGGFREIPASLIKGEGEPGYTCYTSLFKLTLDYLFVLPGNNVEVTRVLSVPKGDELGEGLPRKGISASDHLLVGCEIAW
ncbi:RNA exonuclease NGL2, partial [Tremellales sp. Uapishka_1]